MSEDYLHVKALQDQALCLIIISSTDSAKRATYVTMRINIGSVTYTTCCGEIHIAKSCNKLH